MQLTRFLGLVMFFLAATRGASADAPPRVEPLPFPSDAVTVTFTREEIAARAKAFESKLGGYPPRLKDARDRESTYRAWSEVVRAARQLKDREAGSEQLAVALAALYRQGHNLDVRECTSLADQTIQAALSAYPDSIPVNLEASYFYLQVGPKYVPQGEKALLKLRQLLGNDNTLDVERGFVFAHIYQNRIDEAKRQVDHCLELWPDDKMFQQLKTALQSGRVEAKQR